MLIFFFFFWRETRKTWPLDSKIRSPARAVGRAQTRTNGWGGVPGAGSAARVPSPRPQWGYEGFPAFRILRFSVTWPPHRHRHPTTTTTTTTTTTIITLYAVWHTRAAKIIIIKNNKKEEKNYAAAARTRDIHSSLRRHRRHRRRRRSRNRLRRGCPLSSVVRTALHARAPGKHTRTDRPLCSLPPDRLRISRGRENFFYNFLAGAERFSSIFFYKPL